MIRALIFDVGGVLVRTASRRPRIAWELRLGLDEWQSDEIVFNSEMGTKAQLGSITSDELWQWVGSRLNLGPSELENFRRDFWSEDYLDHDLVNFIRAARTVYQTAIISNATLSLRETLKYRYPIADYFDLIVCSAEEGIMKPDPEIYLRTLKRLGRFPEEVIFIDDAQANINAATELGFRVIRFSERIDLMATLETFGVIVKRDDS